MEDTHVLEGFMNDLMSLPLLLRKGCLVIKCTTDLIRIQLPGTQYRGKHMDFKRAEDGLFYMEVIPLLDTAEQANSSRVVGDNDDKSDEDSDDDDLDDDSDDSDDSDDDDDDDEGYHQHNQEYYGRQYHGNSDTDDEDSGSKDDSNKPGGKRLESIDINCAHERCNHPGEPKLCEMAREFDWKLTGSLKSCGACAKSKATAKLVPKATLEDDQKATRPGEILHLDTTGPYKRTRSKNRYWVGIKDAFTSRVWSGFGPEKNLFTEKIELVLTNLKSRGFPVKYLRLDNAVEWIWLEPVCARLGITMQYTAPNTPQQNAIVEREFPTIWNMVYACLQSSNMSDSDQMLHHWAHAIDDCTIIRNLQPCKSWLNAYEPFGEEPPVKAKDLVPWEALGWMTVCASSNIKPKWKPKAIQVTRVGYAKNHSSDTYIVLKHHNNEYVESRDIQWDEPRRYRKLSLEATRGEAVKTTTPVPTQDSASINRFTALISDDEGEDDEEDDDSGDEGNTGTVGENSTVGAGQQPVAPRLQRELCRLAGYNNGPANNNSYNNARAGILGRTRQATKSVQFAVANNVAAPKDDALL
jgi:transposase InsO family protein